MSIRSRQLPAYNAHVYHRTRSRGVTLVELVVVLTILGVVAGVVGLAIRRSAPIRAADAPTAAIAAARRVAIDSARIVTVDVGGDMTPNRATAYPNGSVVTDTALSIDRLTGAVVVLGPAHAQ